jgi:type IV pilus assembly protein PilW
MFIGKRHQAGFTLTELIIALVLNVILFTAITAICASNLSQYIKQSSTDLLTSQLQTALDLMANDIRRAGYWSSATNNIGTDTNTNPFMSTSSGTDLSINGSNNCILFTYDHNNTGSLPSVSSSSDDDRYGYMLKNGVLQTRPWGATFSCSATNWENVTDPSIITITSLTFTLTTQTVNIGSGSTGISMRSIDISITGELTNNTSVIRTLTQHVRIRNDKFNP